MPEIKLLTEINAPIAICFDLSRSIDLHKISTSETSEEAIFGVTTGLIGLNEYVTWEAVHFGVKQKLTSKITAYERPFHVADEQIKGAFKYFRHTHNFSELDGKSNDGRSIQFQQSVWAIWKDFWQDSSH